MGVEIDAKAYYDCVAEYRMDSMSNLDWDNVARNGNDSQIYIDSLVIENGVNCGFQIKLKEDIIGESSKLIFYVVAQDESI